MSKKQEIISARSSINDDEFIEIIQGKHGIELKIMRSNSGVSVPVTIEILHAIDCCIDLFGATLNYRQRAAK